MKPLSPNTVTVSMACSTKNRTLNHPSHRGTTREAPKASGTNAAAIVIVDPLTIGPQYWGMSKSV